jgi:hypothetical protein
MPAPTSERGFGEFLPGDNPYELGQAAVPRLAALTGIELGAEPTDEEIQEQLFGNWGREKDYRANAAEYSARMDDPDQLADQIADALEDSGILLGFDPRFIDGSHPAPASERAGVIGGGAANLMSRRVGTAIDLHKRGYAFENGVTLLGAARPMTLQTEGRVSFVEEWREDNDDQPPLETDYLREQATTRLERAGLGVHQVFSGDPKAKFKDLAEEAAHRGHLGDAEVLLVQSAPDGSTFNSMREAVGDDRLAFAAGGIEVARTPEQLADARYYANPFSAPSALARWVRVVHMINQRHAGS